MTKNKIEVNLQKVIEEGYQKACYRQKIIPYKKVIFKGFFSEDVNQEILDNQEILENLRIKMPRQKKYFQQILQELESTELGMALPAKFETWIIINPLYLKTELSERLIVDLVETIAHETAHAVIYNITIWQPHADPHAEITNYLQDFYYRKNYDWKKLLND